MDLWRSFSPFLQLLNEQVEYVFDKEVDQASGYDRPEHSPIKRLPRPHDA
jgi:hypothetical protein